MDQPFSGVADTLTLPYTIPTEFLNQRDRQEADAAASTGAAKPFSPL
jgi:hypothetical protein